MVECQYVTETIRAMMTTPSLQNLEQELMTTGSVTESLPNTDTIAAGMRLADADKLS